MTAPRQVLPGIRLVTRRCSERRFFLKPSPQTNALFLYVLAVAAQRYGVAVHAYCVLSNHYHLLVTDRYACLPAFVQYLDSLVARAVNASLGRFEGFWAAATSYSAVSHDAPEDVIAKAAYTLANPVAAGLVQSSVEWPGLWSSPDQIGTKLTVQRPKGFFRENGYMPASVEVEVTVPSGFASASEFRDRLWDALRRLESQTRRDFAAEGRGFLGVAKVLAQRAFAHPPPGEPHFRLNPRVAGRDKWKRLEAISRLTEFLRAYRDARRAMRAGINDVLFPCGTYLLRVMHGVRCAAG